MRKANPVRKRFSKSEKNMFGIFPVSHRVFTGVFSYRIWNWNIQFVRTWYYYPCIHESIHLFIHLFNHSFIHSFIHMIEPFRHIDSGIHLWACSWSAIPRSRLISLPMSADFIRNGEPSKPFHSSHFLNGRHLQSPCSESSVQRWGWLVSEPTPKQWQGKIENIIEAKRQTSNKFRKRFDCLRTFRQQVLWAHRINYCCWALRASLNHSAESNIWTNAFTLRALCKTLNLIFWTRATHHRIRQTRSGGEMF